jgi:hypothetical protein
MTSNIDLRLQRNARVITAIRLLMCLRCADIILRSLAVTYSWWSYGTILAMVQIHARRHHEGLYSVDAFVMTYVLHNILHGVIRYRPTRYLRASALGSVMTETTSRRLSWTNRLNAKKLNRTMRETQMLRTSCEQKMMDITHNPWQH